MNTGRSVLNALLSSESLIKMCDWIKQKLGTKSDTPFLRGKCSKDLEYFDWSIGNWDCLGEWSGAETVLLNGWEF